MLPIVSVRHRLLPLMSINRPSQILDPLYKFRIV